MVSKFVSVKMNGRTNPPYCCMSVEWSVCPVWFWCFSAGSRIRLMRKIVAEKKGF